MTKIIRSPIFFLDDEVDAQVVVLSEHHAIHDGFSFVVSGEAVLNSAGVYDFRIVVPNSTFTFHFDIFMRASGETNYLLYEGGSLSVGTAVTPYNRNRNSANLPLLSILHTPTVTTTGTLLHEVHFGAGNNTGGEGRMDEFLLKNNTTYLLRITSEANTNDVSWLLNFYYYRSNVRNL